MTFFAAKITKKVQKAQIKIRNVFFYFQDFVIIVTNETDSGNFYKRLGLIRLVFWTISIIVLLSSTGVLLMTTRDHLIRRISSTEQKVESMDILRKSIDEQIEYIQRIKKELETVELLKSEGENLTETEMDISAGGGIQ